MSETNLFPSYEETYASAHEKVVTPIGTEATLVSLDSDNEIKLHTSDLGPIEDGLRRAQQAREDAEAAQRENPLPLTPEQREKFGIHGTNIYGSLIVLSRRAMASGNDQIDPDFWKEKMASITKYPEPSMAGATNQAPLMPTRENPVSVPQPATEELFDLLEQDGFDEPTTGWLDNQSFEQTGSPR